MDSTREDTSTHVAVGVQTFLMWCGFPYMLWIPNITSAEVLLRRSVSCDPTKLQIRFHESCVGFCPNLDHDPGGPRHETASMDRSSLAALHRGSGPRASREESPPRERWGRPQCGQMKNIRKDQRHWRSAAASGVLPQRLIPSSGP